MNASRRVGRMTRHKRPLPKLNLMPLMDVFLVLVFFLMINQSSVEVLQQPKQIKLPESVVEEKPRETVVILVGKDEVLVQGVLVASIADIQAAGNTEIESIGARLTELSKGVIGLSTQAIAQSQEVTVLADKSTPFSILKKILATCTSLGYTRVSLAVVQKSGQSTQARHE
jgi:biopolymer transport protein ExbD